MTPEFAETVAPVVRWAKEQGWHWRNAFIAAADGNRLPFDIDVDHSMYGTHYGVQALPVKWFEPDSPQQAIDVLAALGVLPARFSSQWREGYGQGRDDEAAGLSHRLRANLAAVFMTPDAIPEYVEVTP